MVVIFPEFYRRNYSVCHDELVSELPGFCWSSSNALGSSPGKMLLQGAMQTKFSSEGWWSKNITTRTDVDKSVRRQRRMRSWWQKEMQSWTKFGESLPHLRKWILKPNYMVALPSKTNQTGPLGKEINLKEIFGLPFANSNHWTYSMSVVKG